MRTANGYCRFFALALTCVLGACGGSATVSPSPTASPGGPISGVFTAYPFAPVDAPYAIGSDFITSGPDGALWFTFGGGNAVGRITTAGEITRYPLPTAAAFPGGITTGSDGALWFVERASNKIGRITIAGAITEYPAPAGLAAALTSVSGITSGSDGALWFTGGTAVIGRVTTHGAFTEFPLPTPYVGAMGIVSGPDGALWFTEVVGSYPNFPYSYAVGRMTTAGMFSSYPLPVAAEAPGAIATGPDGALWFTDQNGVGRITTAGAVSQYIAVAQTNFICAGPDGAMWVTSYGHGVSLISRVSLTGSVRTFSPPPTLSVPDDITAGPDGALWFTTGDAIGRLR